MGAVGNSTKEKLVVHNLNGDSFSYENIVGIQGAQDKEGLYWNLGNGFNKIFTTHNASFTYFVPNDYAWRQVQRNRLSFYGSDVDLLKRHLIISDAPYSMERLLAITNSRNNSDVELKTAGGILRLNVLLIDNHFYLRWHNTYIKVVRPDYECPDGLIHVLAGPIANLH